MPVRPIFGEAMKDEECRDGSTVESARNASVFSKEAKTLYG